MIFPSIQPIQKVVIAGRDAAAWLAANALARAFGATGLKIEVAEMPSLLRPHDVIPSLPPLEAFHRLLGFEEYALLKATGGVYSLGQSFANFSRAAPPFFHPYGSHGAPIANLDFIQFWIKARQSGLNVPLEEFSLTATAAKQGRFFLPSDSLSAFRTDYAYHLKAQPYVQFLKAHALRRGVEVQPARLFDVRLDEAGRISALVTGDGREIAGDLFIDATGAESLLLGKALGVGFESWSQWFSGNRVLSVSAERLKQMPSFSQVRALSDGCLHMLPVQDVTGILNVYDGNRSKDQEALEAVALITGLPLNSDAVVQDLTVGRRARLWEKNCIALGDAACGLDPIDNAGLHTVQLGLAHLINLFPVSAESASEAFEYNSLITQGIDRIRDFQIGHYKLNRIDNQPVWDRLRGQAIPDALAWKIEMFKARGVVPMLEEESFQTDSWLALFAGHGLMPRSYDPVVDTTPQDDAIRNFQRMLAFIKANVEKMTSHSAFLELYASKDFA